MRKFDDKDTNSAIPFSSEMDLATTTLPVGPRTAIARREILVGWLIIFSPTYLIPLIPSKQQPALPTCMACVDPKIVMANVHASKKFVASFRTKFVASFRTIQLEPAFVSYHI
jgi:hypothetical protein